MDATHCVIVAEAGKFGKPQFSRRREKFMQFIGWVPGGRNGTGPRQIEYDVR